MTPVDSAFSGGNLWDAKLYRYVDDIIIVIPKAEDYEEVFEHLVSVLSELGLELNKDKTRLFPRVEDFLKESAPDELLENLHATFSDLTERLWIMNSTYRTAFIGAYRRGGDEWWSIIEQYRICLRQIGIFLTTTDLSRRIYGDLFNEVRRTKQLGQKSEIKLPILPIDREKQYLESWKNEFEELNQEWGAGITSLRHKLHLLFQGLSRNHSSNLERRQERQLRYIVHRLCLLGLTEVSGELVQILCLTPWAFGDPVDIVDSLAVNECFADLLSLLEFYSSRKEQFGADEYLRAIVLRAIRYVPILSADIWCLLFQYALDPEASVAERLMATETILFRRYMSDGFDLTDTFRADIESVLMDGSVKSNRLKKNLMLILGAQAPDVILNCSYSDPMLDDVCNFIRDTEKLDLFEAAEPEVLREQYYSGIGPGEQGDYSG